MRFLSWCSAAVNGLVLQLFFVAWAYAQNDAGTTPVESVELINPLNNITSLEGLLVAILNIFITLMIPVIVFFIILSGFKYVTAQGNPNKIEEATTMFMYTVIGGVVILAAVAIAEIIRNTVAAF